MAMQSDFAFEGAFDLIAPARQSVPFVFNSPHSGNQYSDGFLVASRLGKHSIRRSEDLFVDELFSDIPACGALLLRANFPRAYLDVNREPYELDPKMFDGPLPSYVNTRSIRVAGGLGTIARVVSEGKEIYRHRLSVEEGLARVERLYRPYHAQLRSIFAKTHVAFNYAFLIDCHSMPSGLSSHGHIARPDFVLGDRYGTSCTPLLTEMLSDLLTERGYTVTRNKPYAGGFITEHYGRPTNGLHALQIEINRALYADEETYERNDRFFTVKRDLTSVFMEVFSEAHGLIQDDLPQAAE